MKTLKVIGFSILCGLLNIRNVNACCCNILPGVGGEVCAGPCPFDCNMVGCNCGTMDGYCVHYHCRPGVQNRCKHPYHGAVKSSERCDDVSSQLSMFDYDSDGVISRREMTEYLVKRNATENSYESNKMLMTFAKKFNDIDINKDGYIQPHEMDNVNRHT